MDQCSRHRMELMQRLTRSMGQIVADDVPSGVGIAVILTGADGKGWTTFTSNQDRSTTVRMLRDAADKLEQHLDAPLGALDRTN